jgi:hemolysin activation/secretion protein
MTCFFAQLRRTGFRHRGLFLLIACILLFAESRAQQTFYLKVLASEHSPLPLPGKDGAAPANRLDSLQCIRRCSETVSRLQSGGYLLAGTDSIRFAGDTCSCYVFAGPPLRWARLGLGNVDEAAVKGTGLRRHQYAGEPIDPQRVAVLRERILAYYENNGYPFASLALDSVSLTDTTVSGVLRLERNRFIRIDSVAIRKAGVIAPVYLYNYLGIKPGDTYNEALIRRIGARMKELSFATETAPAQIVFTEEATRLELSLDGKRGSQFDGIIGLLPRNNEPGKYNLTGDVHLRLLNSFHRGEVIDFNWKALPGQTQDLKLRFNYPFLFNTPFGADFFLGVYKHDTTYLDVNRTIGVLYQLSGNNFVKAFVELLESNLISTAGLENITTLPPYADISQTSYGLSGRFERLDYRLNPRRGFAVEATGSVGNREIRRNADVNPAVYDSLALVNARYKAFAVADYYVPLAARHVIDAGIQAGYQHGENTFDNELFRIGGLKSLRGFDDESILASAYVIWKLEYRYLLEQNSYLFAFYNAAWYRQLTNSADFSDTPQGFGAGMAFETKLGIFSVNYALGREFTNPFQFRTAKIHVGILSYF